MEFNVMSIANAINNLKDRIEAAYDALESKGATIPKNKTTANLPSVINTIETPVLEDKGIVTLNRNTDATSNVSNFERDITPGDGYNGISHVKVKYRALSTKITPTTQQQVKTASTVGGIVGYREITVNPVTASIDSNIQPENIKNGVTILGVTGNVVGPKEEQSKTVTPTAAGLTVTPDSGKALSSVVINGDGDLVAGNIKKDVNIFGVTGTYEGSGGGGLQGYTLRVSGCAGSGNLTIYHSNGTSEVVSIPFDSWATYTDVTYFSGLIRDGVEQGQIENGGNYNFLLTSDMDVTFTWGCILKGSLVNLWNGSTKKIEDITYDDEILCWDFDNGRYASAKPFWIKQAQRNSFYWINKFENGREIKTTGTVAGHRFFNIDEGKFLYNTECVNNQCYTLDGYSKLLDAKYVEEDCIFYNIYTHYHMNMFVNGILTGFRYNNLYPIKDMKFIIDNNRKQRSRMEFENIPDSWYHGMRCSEQIDSVKNIYNYVIQRELIKK